ncbi:hypothetical protein BMF94_1441 [Rhodotorula taiwanensis]|uniref:HPt domain-containing protein n=1 Tax=Rhodotorula taiwanensis TaxID=741276 RepID=A0A2S5BFJ2_9BASI|nr:hypothetical protein BMF94_1441 [Rhodotorula taiwanensis]
MSSEPKVLAAAPAGVEAGASPATSTAALSSSMTSKADAAVTTPAGAKTTSSTADADDKAASGSGEATKATSAGDAEPTAEDEEKLLGKETAGVVDRSVFDQLLEIDDDDEREFSKSLAFDYIHQAETTITEIRDALQSEDLDTLSARGHFLKGSSAALGLQRVQHSCEALQHFGKNLDAHGEGPTCDDAEALRRCKILLGRLVREQKDAKAWLESFYQETA